MWIEILLTDEQRGKLLSCPAWGMWIEIKEELVAEIGAATSCPAWGMWIEISSLQKNFMSSIVMPRMGHVD